MVLQSLTDIFFFFLATDWALPLCMCPAIITLFNFVAKCCCFVKCTTRLQSQIEETIQVSITPSKNLTRDDDCPSLTCPDMKNTSFDLYWSEALSPQRGTMVDKWWFWSLLRMNVYLLKTVSWTGSAYQVTFIFWYQKYSFNDNSCVIHLIQLFAFFQHLLSVTGDQFNQGSHWWCLPGLPFKSDGCFAGVKPFINNLIIFTIFAFGSSHRVYKKKKKDMKVRKKIWAENRGSLPGDWNNFRTESEESKGRIAQGAQ